MAPFDPNTYAKEEEKSTFDPNTYAVEEQNPWMPEAGFVPTSQTESILRGGAQGLSAEFADEAAAGGLSTIEDRPYQEVLGEQRKRFKEAEKSHPISYGVSKTVGAIAPMFAPGIGSVAKAAPMITSTAMGALQGYGESENNEEAPGKILRGGAFGFAGGALAKGVGKAIDPEYWREVANSRALSQLGGYVSKINKLGVDRARGAAETVRKAGVLSTDTDKMVKGINDLNREAGENIGKILKDTDTIGAAKVDINQVASELEQEVPMFEPSIFDSVKNFMSMGGEQIDLETAQLLKNRLRQAGKFGTNYQTGSSEKVDLARDAYWKLSKHMDDAIERGQGEVRDPEVLREYLRNKKMYADTKGAASIAERKQLAEAGNKREFGLTDSVMAAGGLASGDPTKALAAFGAKKAWEKYGNIGISKFAGAMENATRPLNMSMSSQAQAGLVRGAQNFYPYAGMTKDQAIEHFLRSSRDPEYQEQMKLQSEGEDQKKKIAPIEPPSLGQQLGSAIDSFTWSDSIGLDPQERGEDGLYAEQVPQPASIKPFSFKKLFPSKSAVGSEVKQLPDVTDLKMGENGWNRDIITARPLEGPPVTKTFKNNANLPSENVMLRKLDLREGSEGINRDYFYPMDQLTGEGAMYPSKKEGTPMFSYARNPTATTHEHIHNQIEGLNRINPKASTAMDEYLKSKAKSYDIPIQHITTRMHGPKEFMTIVSDILHNKKIRDIYIGSTEYNPNSRVLLQKLRRFYTDAATEVQNMDEQDVMRIVGEHEARWSKFNEKWKGKE